MMYRMIWACVVVGGAIDSTKRLNKVRERVPSLSEFHFQDLIEKGENLVHDSLSVSGAKLVEGLKDRTSSYPTADSSEPQSTEQVVFNTWELKGA